MNCEPDSWSLQCVYHESATRIMDDLTDVFDLYYALALRFYYFKWLPYLKEYAINEEDLQIVVSMFVAVLAFIVLFSL